MRLGRSERALRDLDQAAGLGLKDVGLELFRAVALLNLGRLKECEAAATRAIELGPNLPDPYYIRALARGYQRRIDEAKPDFERAVANGLDSNSQAYGRKLFGIAAPK